MTADSGEVSETPPPRWAVALVEDDPDLSVYMRLLVAKYPDFYMVEGPTFTSAEEALAYEGWASVACAVLDWSLASGTGSDVAHWLRANHPHVKTILGTAHATRGAVFRSVDLTPFDAVLTKPFSGAELSRTLTSLMPGEPDTEGPSA